MVEKVWRQFVDVDLKQKLDVNRHLGHIILESFKKKQPEDIAQINGATDEKETYESLLNRVVCLARSLTNFGCRPGDVLALAGTNHLDLGVPFFAGMINGLPVCGIDPAFKYVEIKSALNLSKPKIAFCDYTSKETYTKVAKELGIDLTVVSFFEGDLSMHKFIGKYDDNTPTDDFKPPSFDPNEIYAWLMSTSGTTGVPKFVAVKQASIPASLPPMLDTMLTGITTDTNYGKQHISMVLSPVQWASAFLNKTAGLFARLCVLMTTRTGDINHIIDVINKYKPDSAPGSPSIWALIMQNDKPCDLTSFHCIGVGGAKIYKDMLEALKRRLRPNVALIEGYGQTESLGIICINNPGVSPPGSCGKIETGVLVKLVDENGKEITEPRVPGELLYKGPMFDGYYMNPEETAKAFTEDGWLKTGDLLYRDENDYYYFVERLKMIIKYRTIHIIPTELEEFIRQHPDVLDVCVSSIDHPTDQQWPVAVVVRRPGSNVTAQEIKDIIAENLSDSKKLRGGVIFVDKLPMTSSGKLARMAVRTIAATTERE